jgi:hypothetical protein
VGLRRVIPWETAVVLGSFDQIDHRALELQRSAAPVAKRLRVGLTPAMSGLSSPLRADLIRSSTLDLGTIEIAAAEYLPRADVWVALTAPTSGTTLLIRCFSYRPPGLAMKPKRKTPSSSMDSESCASSASAARSSPASCIQMPSEGSPGSLWPRSNLTGPILLGEFFSPQTGPPVSRSGCVVGETHSARRQVASAGVTTEATVDR